MSVAANQLIKRQEGCRRSLPVEESTHIYQGTMVFINANGYADDDTATGVNGFAGIAIGEADNSGGADGAKNAEFWADGDFELVGAGTFSQADIGSPVYADDNFTISLSIGATSVPIGRVVGFVSTTKLIVRIKPTGTGALPVAALTTITPADAAGTPDYAIAAVINSSAYGFSNAAELITLLYVVKNLQQRVLDLEARSRD